MRSDASLEVNQIFDIRGAEYTRISRLRSQGALVLRPTKEVLPAWSAAWNLQDRRPVTARLVAGAAGPLGGDVLHLDVTVTDGAALMLGTVAATMVLPGVHETQSISEVSLSVADDATLIWNPGLQIAAANCHHVARTTIHLAPTARLYVREEIALGRHGELPGRFHQRLRVVRGDKAIYDQELAVGSSAPGWQGAAVTGDRRSLGTIIIVDPINAMGSKAQNDLPADTALMKLSSDTALITSVAPDAVKLDRRLSSAFAGIVQ